MRLQEVLVKTATGPDVSARNRTRNVDICVVLMFLCLFVVVFLPADDIMGTLAYDLIES